ncbi:hypothetical protein MY4824_007395 [Beauveria thailandica]
MESAERAGAAAGGASGYNKVLLTVVNQRVKDWIPAKATSAASQMASHRLCANGCVTATTFLDFSAQYGVVINTAKVQGALTQFNSTMGHAASRPAVCPPIHHTVIRTVHVKGACARTYVRTIP